MYSRNITDNVVEALQDTPAVFIRGARQVGKSTLVQELAATRHPAQYVTLDNATVLAAATSDPQGFLAGFPGPMILDEIQRAPRLLPAIKEAIDRDRRPGRFLLTGSANLLTVPTVAESLAGRVEVLTLWPLSQGERAGRREDFIDRLFQGGKFATRKQGLPQADLLERIVVGGYPEPLGRVGQKRRAAWFESYLTTILERDVRDISNIQDLAALPRLLQFLSARTASLLNQSEVSRSLGIPNSTLGRYMDLLEGVFLVFKLPAWTANLGKRLVKSPKLYVADTGLAAHLAGADVKRLQAEPELSGRLLENFAVAEIMKQATWSDTSVRLYHFRTTAGREVDLVLEDSAGRVAGIEIKLSATLETKHFAGLKALQESLGERFQAGVVLYGGTEVVPFGERLWAVPVAGLWQGED
ncbi:MAG TPA: ATP-binding protein [Desulfovibrio sp.]|uniref:ATP-binding protein n=1 Tax=Desulfovibrio sp. TaxID=885 RepID=UPI002B89D74F|nr:ATP-binding protein [Desulfovibrio sp.]HMM39517.1 ATP-binding protein [Desulfovibrio sp.]